jgi:hypothetical protein
LPAAAEPVGQLNDAAGSGYYLQRILSSTDVKRRLVEGDSAVKVT